MNNNELNEEEIEYEKLSQEFNDYMAEEAKNVIPENPFSTEQQQYAIDVIIAALHDAYAPLCNKKKELELLEKTEEVKDSIDVISLRLDVLIKVETKLLEPIKEEYAFIERGESLAKGELFAMRNHRKSIFVSSIMQGL
jgi:hypothetical protein